MTADVCPSWCDCVGCEIAARRAARRRHLRLVPRIPRHVCGERCELPHGLCVYDVVAACGPLGLNDVAVLFGVSRQAIHQIEVKARKKLARRIPILAPELAS